jgi:hypothetical protein
MNQKNSDLQNILTELDDVIYSSESTDLEIDLAKTLKLSIRYIEELRKQGEER